MLIEYPPVVGVNNVLDVSSRTIRHLQIVLIKNLAHKCALLEVFPDKSIEDFSDVSLYVVSPGRIEPADSASPPPLVCVLVRLII